MEFVIHNSVMNQTHLGGKKGVTYATFLKKKNITRDIIVVQDILHQEGFIHFTRAVFILCAGV